MPKNGKFFRATKWKNLNEEDVARGNRPSAPSIDPHTPAVVGPWPTLGGCVVFNTLITLVALEIAHTSVQREI